jgi:hypothetical protein
MNSRNARLRVGRRRFVAGGIAGLVGMGLAGCVGARDARLAPGEHRVVVEGLHHPRAIAFAPDGTLFLGEAGSDLLDGRITTVDPAGRQTPIHEGLPRFPSPYGDAEDVGLAGIEFHDGAIYGVIGQGEFELASFMFRVDADGTFVPLANLKHFPALGFPPQAPTPAIDNESGTVIYDPTNVYDLAYHPEEDAFYVADAGSNWILKVSLDGRTVEYVAQYTRVGDHTVPTGIVVGPDGAIYHGLLAGYPYSVGAGVISRIGTDREITDFILDITMPIDVAWGPDGEFYVLEFAQGLDNGSPPQMKPRSGRVLRKVGDGMEVVFERLNYPYAMAFDGEGYLWITVNSSFEEPGTGELREYRLP